MLVTVVTQSTLTNTSDCMLKEGKRSFKSQEHKKEPFFPQNGMSFLFQTFSLNSHSEHTQVDEVDSFFHTSMSLVVFAKCTGQCPSLLTQSPGLEGGPEEGTEVGHGAGSGQISGQKANVKAESNKKFSFSAKLTTA